MLGFSPCAFLFSTICNSAAAIAGIQVGPLAARLKSCPDAYRCLKAILHVALQSNLTAQPGKKRLFSDQIASKFEEILPISSSRS
jgi:hypothetical protein